MRLGLVGLAMAASAAWGEQATEKACSELTNVSLDHAKVVQAAPAQVADLETMKIDGAARLPAFCRVQVVDRPSQDSEIKTEVWLPLAGWNGKLRAQGN